MQYYSWLENLPSPTNTKFASVLGKMDAIQDYRSIETVFSALDTTKTIVKDGMEATSFGMQMAIDTLLDIKWTIEKSLGI